MAVLLLGFSFSSVDTSAAAIYSNISIGVETAGLDAAARAFAGSVLSPECREAGVRISTTNAERSDFAPDLQELNTACGLQGLDLAYGSAMARGLDVPDSPSSDCLKAIARLQNVTTATDAVVATAILTDVAGDCNLTNSSFDTGTALLQALNLTTLVSNYSRCVIASANFANSNATNGTADGLANFFAECLGATFDNPLRSVTGISEVCSLTRSLAQAKLTF
jgi:hypothetical protein